MDRHGSFFERISRTEPRPSGGEAICALMDVEEAPITRLRCTVLHLKLAEQDVEKRQEHLEKALEYVEAVLKVHESNEAAFFCRGKLQKSERARFRRH